MDGDTTVANKVCMLVGCQRISQLLSAREGAVRRARIGQTFDQWLEERLPIYLVGKHGPKKMEHELEELQETFKHTGEAEAKMSLSSNALTDIPQTPTSHRVSTAPSSLPGALPEKSNEASCQPSKSNAPRSS
jgi:hypothetical protein